MPLREPLTVDKYCCKPYHDSREKIFFVRFSYKSSQALKGILNTEPNIITMSVKKYPFNVVEAISRMYVILFNRNLKKC